MMLLALLLLAIGVASPAAHASQPLDGSTTSLNERPIIGVLSQPGDPAPKSMSYIAASYIKWVESAGARVIPIFYDMNTDEVRERFKVINGLLIPGGGARLSPGHRFYDTAKLLVDLALEANDNGDYFPVHGTCLGLETLAHVISQNYTILTDFDAQDAAAPLLYTHNAEASHMVKALPPDVVRDLQNFPIAMENHVKGLAMASFVENPKLSNFFNVLSLSIDKSGNPYISTMEAKKYPITATQWHPEKNAFEWSMTIHIPHSPEAIRMTQEVANFFVSEARKNMHRAQTIFAEDQMLIYNWIPHFTGIHDSSGHTMETDFEQAYFFEEARGRRKETPSTKAAASLRAGTIRRPAV